MVNYTLGERKKLVRKEDLKTIDSFTLEEALELPNGIQLDLIVAQILTPHVYITDPDKSKLYNEVVSRYFVVRESTPPHIPGIELWQYAYHGGHCDGFYPKDGGNVWFSDCAGAAIDLLYSEGLLGKWKDVNLKFRGSNELTLTINGNEYGPGDTAMVICKAILKTMWPKKG